LPSEEEDGREVNVKMCIYEDVSANVLICRLRFEIA
jgi:hypothetical protein